MRRRVAPWALLLAIACGEDAANAPPIAVPGADRTVKPGVELELSGEGSSDPDGSITKYAWDFGDGQTGDGPVVRHAWAEEAVYAVTLEVTDDQGASARAALAVTVSANPDNQAPLALISGPGRGEPNETLSFNGSRSDDPDGTIVRFAWDFGDGAQTEGEFVEHAFDSEGSFVVTLTVLDDGGRSAQGNSTVVIGTEANRPPTARAGSDKTSEIGGTVRFDARASDDVDGTIERYAWDFGDGGTADTAQAEHVYSSAGVYSARLTVEDDQGATGTDELIVTVVPLTNYDGDWTLNPNVASVTCDNTRRTYQVPFPAGQIALAGTTTATVRATVGSSGEVLSGAIDRSGPANTLSLAWTGSETDATCGTAMIEHRLSSELTTPGTMSEGRFTVIYTWTDPFCTCTRTFEFTGQKQ